MTAQAETAQGTNSALEPVAPGALARVKGDKPWTMLDLADMLAGPAREFSKADSLPKPAPQVEFTDVLRQALRALPDVFGVVMPDEARALDRHEVKAITDEVLAINTILKELNARKEAIKESVRNHQDHQAEASGLKDGVTRVAEGAAKGHWLLAREDEPFETPVDGYTDCWQQRYVSGRAFVNGAEIFVMEAEGTITREEYLGCTSSKRHFDAGKMEAFIRRNPERGLAILTRMTTRSAPSASVYAPKK
jgi:hypothetical protein